MHEVVVHERAEEELKAAADFYESRQAGLGEEFLQELSMSFNRLKNHPFSYSILLDEYRRYLMPRFPYGVVYRVEGERVLVFAVAHLRRRPSYWSNRE